MKDSAAQVQLTSAEASPRPRGGVEAHGRVRAFLSFRLPQPEAGGVSNWLESMW